MSTDLVTTALKHTEVNLSQVLHGEQYLEVVGDLPTEGQLKTTGTVIDVCDKKSGAVVVTNCKFCRTVDDESSESNKSFSIFVHRRYV